MEENGSLGLMERESSKSHSDPLVRPPRLGFIGFGEVTRHLVDGLRGEGLKDLLIYSRSVLQEESKKRAENEAFAIGGRLAIDYAELFANSDFVFSSVHGNISLEIARRAAQFIRPGQYFVDLNNAPASMKQESALCIEEAGGRFIDVGLLELPIQRKHRSLMYASGEAAQQFKDLLTPFGMNIKVIEGGVGRSATIKAIANIFMKGLQGVFLEFAISAKKAGIPLEDLEPLLVKPVLDVPREKDVGFWIIRGALLAERKKEEMYEAMKMMEGLGTDPVMLRATVERLSRVAQFKLNEHFAAEMSYLDYEKILDKMFQIGEELKMDIR